MVPLWQGDRTWVFFPTSPHAIAYGAHLLERQSQQPLPPTAQSRENGIPTAVFILHSRHLPIELTV